MNRDSNVYTFLFATLMVLIVASSLAFTASSLKERQISNVRKEKMQNILATIGIETEREEAEALYNKYITEELTLKEDGSIDPEINAFDIKLNTIWKNAEGVDLLEIPSSEDLYNTCLLYTSPSPRD